jgi:hypothetical protein
VEDSGKTGSKSQAGGALGSRRGSRSSLGEFDDDLHAVRPGMRACVYADVL